MLKKITAIMMTAILAASLTACGTATQESGSASVSTQTKSSAASSQSSSAISSQSSSAASQSDSEDKADAAGDSIITTANTSSTGVIDAGDMFSKRDLTQTADTSPSQSYTLSDGENITIYKAGVYIISGSANNVSIIVEAGDEDKVQLVLDGVNITNQSAPAIFVKNADKVFVTTTSTQNSLSVTGSFEKTGDVNTDAVIYSKDDLVLNGTGTLSIQSSNNGISSNDDLKITGGTININCAADGLEANELIAIADGNITVNTQKDAVHAEKDKDDTTGFVYICGGTLDLTAGDDAIHATAAVQIDGGTLTISAAEGIEATYVQINDGTVKISSSDDGINGANKSSAYNTTVEINGGDLTIDMGQGDTDGIDSNGDLYVNGGTITINAQSPFDYDGTGKYSGGTLIVNGTQTTELQNQFMGGGMGGGMRGGMNGGNMPQNGNAPGMSNNTAF